MGADISRDYSDSKPVEIIRDSLEKTVISTIGNDRIFSFKSFLRKISWYVKKSQIEDIEALIYSNIDNLSKDNLRDLSFRLSSFPDVFMYLFEKFFNSMNDSQMIQVLSGISNESQQTLLIFLEKYGEVFEDAVWKEVLIEYIYENKNNLVLLMLEKIPFTKTALNSFAEMVLRKSSMSIPLLMNIIAPRLEEFETNLLQNVINSILSGLDNRGKNALERAMSYNLLKKNVFLTYLNILENIKPEAFVFFNDIRFLNSELLAYLLYRYYADRGKVKVANNFFNLIRKSSIFANELGNIFPDCVQSVKIEGLIGSGGFGQVFLVSTDNFKYALKVPKIPKIKMNESMFFKEKVINTLIYSCKLSAEQCEIQKRELVDLNSKSKYCIFTEYNPNTLDYRTFQETSEFRELTVDQRKSICKKLLYAVNKLHVENDVYHRDIKPENMLIDDNFNIYLIDFGLSCIGDAGSLIPKIRVNFILTPARIMSFDCKCERMGTPRYLDILISKGDIESLGCDWELADLYSVGAVCYETLTGKIFMRTDISEKSRITKEFFPEEYADFLFGMLSPNKEDRLNYNDLIKLI